MKDQFIAIIRKALGGFIPEKRLSRLHEGTSLRELEIDSVEMPRFVLRLEEAFKISFTDNDLAPENFKDIASLIELLRKKGCGGKS